jgi:nucleotide-binding universal stress UspA family protein
LIVGFDGSEPAYRALDAARRLISNRVGMIEIVYVAHPPVGAGMSSEAQVEISKGFDEAERQFAEEIRARFQGDEQRWRFQRRDGVIAHELLAAADELSRDYGDEATAVIVVGSAVQTYHHVVGSVPVSLVRHAKYPIVVVP